MRIMKPNPQSTTRFLTLGEVADELGASRSSVRHWLAQARIRAYSPGYGPNAKLYFLRDDVDRWLQSSREAHEEDDEDLEEVDLYEDETDLADDEDLEDYEDPEVDQDEEENDDEEEDDDEEGLEDGDEDDDLGKDEEEDLY